MRIEEPAVEVANPADVAEQQAVLDDPAVWNTPRQDLPLEAAVPYDDEER
jgi:hypothetical protein